jgi:hypothetical protein
VGDLLTTEAHSGARSKGELFGIDHLTTGAHGGAQSKGELRVRERRSVKPCFASRNCLMTMNKTHFHPSVRLRAPQWLETNFWNKYD